MQLAGVEFRDGIPFPVKGEPVTARRMNGLLAAALSAIYEPLTDFDGKILPEEMQYIGMTRAEVGALKIARLYSHGDMEATKFVHDRVIGKAKQQIESLSVNVGIKDYLAILEEREKQERQVTVTVEARNVTESVVEDGVTIDLPSKPVGLPDFSEKSQLTKFALLEGI